LEAGGAWSVAGGVCGCSPVVNLQFAFCILQFAMLSFLPHFPRPSSLLS
jgi:hypothetical protein